MYNIKNFLLLLLPLTLVFPICGKQKPNILFIFADDQCFETVGHLGLTDIETPNLDRLMKSGTSFTRAYNMGSWSGAVCVASRHMLNTGRFLWRAEKASRTAEAEREAGRFWSENMKAAGYKTYMTGKWHVRAKAENCFDVTSNVRGGMPNQTQEGYNRPLPGKLDPWSPSDPKFEGFWKGGKHWSEIVADDALEFLSLAKKHVNNKPYFAYIAFNAPHDPRQAPKAYVDKYPLDRIKMPSNFLPMYPHKDEIGCKHSLRDEKLGPMPRTEHSVKVHRQEYYAIITHMDEQIGKILDGLKKSGLEENTYIFFSADHGLAVGHHGLFGKQNLYEHSTRVPFIIKGPDIPEGRKVSAPIYLQDIMATSLAIAEIKKPEHVEFTNILPLALGKTKKSPYKEIYGAYLNVQRSITKNNIKLLVYPNVPLIRIFDITQDPEEKNDISNTTIGKKLKLKLFPRLLKLQEQMGDQLDLAKLFPTLTVK
ncbi:MAG: sulfatase-like hydrolase/transferase [Opitutae bacterium]|nr:sulfatase-like hydrolase/transferase [Opitutae bacterium]